MDLETFLPLLQLQLQTILASRGFPDLAADQGAVEELSDAAFDGLILMLREQLIDTGSLSIEEVGVARPRDGDSWEFVPAESLALASQSSKSLQRDNQTLLSAAVCIREAAKLIETAGQGVWRDPKLSNTIFIGDPPVDYTTIGPALRVLVKALDDLERTLPEGVGHLRRVDKDASIDLRVTEIVDLR